MFLNIEVSSQTEQLIQQTKQHIAALLQDFELKTVPLIFESLDDLDELFDADQIFLVNDGMIHVTSHDQILVSFDEGDIVGITRSFGVPFPKLSTDDYVELTPIKRDAFLKHIYASPKRMHIWSHFLICQNAFMSNLLAEQTKALMKPVSGFQGFKAGDIIIQQGDPAELVYTLLDGIADVFVDGVKVGSITKDEIFGVLAVISNSTRTATVQAQTNCTVTAVPQEEFVSLIEAQPKAAMRLIESLAHKITQLNQTIVDFQN